jgi:hypothetical protein
MSEHYPTKDGKIVFESIDSVSSNKAQLFSSSKKWIVENFKSAKSTIQSEDVLQGQILGVGVVNIQKEVFNLPVKFNYQIDIKEKKYRLRIYNLAMFSGDLETRFDDLPNETPHSLSDKKYLKTTQRAKEFCDYFTDILESFNKSVINSSKDDF